MQHRWITHAKSSLLGFGLGIVFGVWIGAAPISSPVERVFRTLTAPLNALMPAGNADQDFSALSIPITCGLIGVLVALPLSLIISMTTPRR